MAFLVVCVTAAAAGCSRSAPAVGAHPVDDTNDIQVVVYNRSGSRAAISVEYERGARRRLGNIDGGVEGLLSFAWRSDLRVRLLSRIGNGPLRSTNYLTVERGNRLEMIVLPHARPTLRVIT